VSHNLSGRMYRFLDVGMLLLGSLLGLASPSMAQQIPGAIPGSGSPGLPPSVTAPPTLAPSAPRRSAPGSALPSGPAGVPSPSVPGSTPSLSVPGPTPLIPGQPGPSQGTTPGIFTAPTTGPSQGTTPGIFTAPTTGQPPSAPAAPEPGEAATAPAPLPPAREELSPIERLVAGNTLDPNALLRQFGYDLFTRVPTTFAPVTDVPVGPDYVIGPGDNLNILLWGGVQEGYQVEVNRNGSVALPRLGVVQVWGLTLDQVQRLLQQRFSEFYADFRMAVTLGKLRTILVYVVGEVRQPGAYTVSSLSTVINALFASGGPTKNGSLRRIQLVRQGRQIHTLDLYDLLLQGNKSQDTTLQSGDTILVPLIGPVAGVAGNVKRPAIYELDPGTTLQRLLELAGGVTALGYLQRVQVERPVANERRIVVDVDLSAPRPKAAPTDLWKTRIADGDLVRIFAILTALENSVQLEGHTLRPGRYELKPGMRLRDVLTSYTVLLPEPYLEYGEIVRYIGADLRRTVVPFNLGNLLAGDPAQNPALHPQDIVRVFARADFVDPPQVRISGLVHRPGFYLLTEGMRVGDLVFRAGNVLKFAYLERAELTRRTLGQAGDNAIRVEIDLNKALEGDGEHNLPLQDFDHLVVRQVSDIELQRNIEQTDESRLQAGRLGERGQLPPRDADLLDQARLQVGRPGERGQLPPRDADLLDQGQGRSVRVYPLVESDEQATAALRRAGRFVEHVVEIRGEVRFPGFYPLIKGERLGSALRRAGGFTQNAYLRGATFTRVHVREEQGRRLQELIREEELSLLAQSATETQAALSQEEVKGQQQAVDFRRDLLTRLKAVQPDGRIVIRLRPLDAFAGTVDDIELEPGDRLVVPQVPQYVSVLGEVYNRTSLLYEPGKTVANYLAKVGGIKPTANEDEIYLVQIDGTVISNTQNQFAIVLANGQTKRFKDFFAVQPQPGDSIVVPRRTVTPATLRNTRDIVQIIFQGVSSLGIIAALLASL
jgi:polysaccharide biosynthesis/export protein